MVEPAPGLPEKQEEALPYLAMRRMQVGRRMVLVAEGEIDLVTAPEIARSAAEALADGALELWIDLSDARFIDSTGIHVSGGSRVICLAGAVRRALALAGVDEGLPVHASCDEAHRRG